MGYWDRMWVDRTDGKVGPTLNHSKCASLASITWQNMTHNTKYFYFYFLRITTPNINTEKKRESFFFLIVQVLCDKSSLLFIFFLWIGLLGFKSSCLIFFACEVDQWKARFMESKWGEPWNMHYLEEKVSLFLKFQFTIIIWYFNPIKKWHIY